SAGALRSASVVAALRAVWTLERRVGQGRGRRSRRPTRRCATKAASWRAGRSSWSFRFQPQLASDARAYWCGAGTTRGASEVGGRVFDDRHGWLDVLADGRLDRAPLDLCRLALEVNGLALGAGRERRPGAGDCGRALCGQLARIRRGPYRRARDGVRSRAEVCPEQPTGERQYR